ncbi:MAG TPA: hypothetical protein VKG38_18325 [Solirubrobacteraceae bacterium]|nr:hypothetical protein [Solirubrobacteraceae bacterium]
MPAQSSSPDLGSPPGRGAFDGPTGSDAVLPMIVMLFVILALVGTVVLVGSIWAAALAAIGTACMIAVIMLWMSHLTDDGA